jgi:hypothetical protein
MPEVTRRETSRVQLDAYGLRLEVTGDWPEVIEEVRRDFAWFAAGGEVAGAVSVRVERRRPDYTPFEKVEASFATPRNVVYNSNGRSAIDYFGSALSVYDRGAGTLLVQGEDLHLVHEAIYHFLLSVVGEHLDSIAMPRLHALGVAGRKGALALLLPSGGGKSTLALHALRDGDVRLISEDSPLLDRRGFLHPFPLRVGVNPHQAAELPSNNVRRIERMEFDPKLLLDLDSFRERIEPRPQPLRHLVIGSRSLSEAPQLAPLPKRAALRTLMREVVVGVGLYQGMEFVLQRGMGDLLGQVRPAFVRSAACATALRRAQVWGLTLGRDHERNWKALRTLL